MLSETEPRPSLLPLLLEALLKASLADLGTRKESLRETSATIGGGTEGDIDDLRSFGEDSLGDRLSATTTLVIDTEVVAGVSTGRLVLPER